MDVIAHLKGIFLLCQIFGILPFGVKKLNGTFVFVESKGWFAYTKLIFVASFFLQVYIFWYLIVFNWHYVSGKSIRMVLVTSTLSTIMSNFLIFRSLFSHSHIFCFWLNKFNIIFSNVPESTLKKIRTLSILLMVVTGIFLISMACSEMSLRYINGEFEKKGTFVFFMTCIMVFCFYVSVWEIKLFIQFFLVILCLLRAYYKDMNKTFRTGSSSRQFWFHFLRNIRLKDLEIKDLLDFVHEFFIPAITCRLIWGFTNILFNVTSAARLGIPHGIQIIWAVYIGLDIFSVILLCQLVEKESQKVQHYLHGLFINWDDKELRNEIEIYSLQVQHKQIEFNALGFHRLNFTLLYTMVSSLTSTAIILLQVDSQPYVPNDYCDKIKESISSPVENKPMVFYSGTPPNITKA